MSDLAGLTREQLEPLIPPVRPLAPVYRVEAPMPRSAPVIVEAATPEAALERARELQLDNWERAVNDMPAVTESAPGLPNLRWRADLLYDGRTDGGR